MFVFMIVAYVFFPFCLAFSFLLSLVSLLFVLPLFPSVYVNFLTFTLPFIFLLFLLFSYLLLLFFVLSSTSLRPLQACFPSPPLSPCLSTAPPRHLQLLHLLHFTPHHLQALHLSSSSIPTLPSTSFPSLNKSYSFSSICVVFLSCLPTLPLLPSLKPPLLLPPFLFPLFLQL